VINNILYDIFIKKSITDVDIKNHIFLSTDGTNFHKYGDFYTIIEFNYNKLVYIIDYKLKDELMNELSPNEYVIELGTNIQKEIIIFDELYQDDIKTIICHHMDDFISVYLSDGENSHHIDGPSVYYYELVNKSFRLIKQEYYIRGKKFEIKLQFNRYKKFKKLKKLKNGRKCT